MDAFLEDNSEDLLQRCQRKLRARSSALAAEVELGDGIALLLKQLVKTLRSDDRRDDASIWKTPGSADGTLRVPEISAVASKHGLQLYLHGFSVNQVVHGYSDLRQAIIDLAHDRNATLELDEFNALNRYIDYAIADAVAEYTTQRHSAGLSRHVYESAEEFGAFVHELRNFLGTAQLAKTVLEKAGEPMQGAAGKVLDRSLRNMGELIDRAVADVKVAAGLSPELKLIALAEVLQEIQASANLLADSVRCELVMGDVVPGLMVVADKGLLLGAIGNVVQNAFKFTAPGTQVRLGVIALAETISIEVRDQCGGLEPGVAENMFKPFIRSASNQIGLGLGLSIAKRSVELCGGHMHVENVPGKGCVVSMTLPRTTHHRAKGDGPHG